MLEFSIITISTFVTVLNECVKHGARLMMKKDVSTYIPMFSIAFGIALGIGGYYTPDVDMGNNIIEAIFIGISAGAAATGINQIGKQLNKKETLVPPLSAEEMMQFLDSVVNTCEDVDFEYNDTDEECDESDDDGEEENDDDDDCDCEEEHEEDYIGE